MRTTLRNLCKYEIHPHSSIRIVQKCDGQRPFETNSKLQESKNENNIKNISNNYEYRENEIKIQMLSKSLFQQVFGDNEQKIDPILVEKYHNNLNSFGLTPGTSAAQPDVNIKLPPLKGTNIQEHFYEIGKEQTKEYCNLIELLLSSNIPKMPKHWNMKDGWSKYDSEGNAFMVSHPEEQILIFDVEVCMEEGSAPTMACAVGIKHWYSWTSPSLLPTSPEKTSSNFSGSVRHYIDNDFIPLESDSDMKSRNAARLIIGHNVSFDRARIRNQYHLNQSAMRFLDTMSLHVCVSGITSYQRAMLKSNKELNDDDLSWSSQSSLNSLLEVFKLYCGANHSDKISKESRSIFVSGSLTDIRENFQSLMTYCAKDVVATYRVFEKLYPLYCSRFPHPVTFAGILELGLAYLPVNSNWSRYINEANLIYKDLDIESSYLLAKRANQACRLFHDNAYREDLWMWDQDWTLQEYKLKANKTRKLTNIRPSSKLVDMNSANEHNELMDKFQYLFELSSLLPVKSPLLPGYPAWYRKLCAKMSAENWQPGPSSIGTGMQVCPKLLSLTWEGYPLHFIRGNGWGFLVPFKEPSADFSTLDCKIPLEQLVRKCPVVEIGRSSASTQNNHDFNKLKKDVEVSLGKKDYYAKSNADPTKGRYTGTGVWCNVELENSCWFFKLPHKDGDSHRVGNPLARDFLVKFSENVLAGDNATAERIIKIARMLSYWRNNRERISNQLIAVCGDKILPNPKKTLDRKKNSSIHTAAILPLVVACGTLTRRAMEPTWMTASNAQEERVGSELRAMVQAPRGYCLIGADVDSQELWIASVLGDADQTGIHGATPLGWMTLNGTKSNNTDMHSVTAHAVGISRSHAKILNYARIYGAGQSFASRLLKQFNPTITDGEARSKASKMFAMTKGKKAYFLKDEFKKSMEDRGYSKYETLQWATRLKKPITEIFHNGKWYGGTESAMFNRLEEIAEMEQPKTPFLNCQLSRALEPQMGNEDRFLPTRINWVVQSGAVDFLHLMLVCMRWLMSTKIRFCLSFHDEIRYLVKDEYAYQAALAMHVTNMLTRSFCASRLGLNDLPQSIAFFTSVEVDTVLRKEAQLDYKTPSNPHGLLIGYDVPYGESLNVFAAIEKAKGNDLNKWAWHKNKHN